MERYEESFERYKKTRKLQWMTSLGKVHLELELQDRTLEFDVAPVYATIIYNFQEQG